uniref:ATP-dependent Clp protease proteolytic subunit n=1 Tax=Biophytum sensitivum TaxID=1898900 RepID=A0A8E8PCU7_9ROSI|nr:clp protease proteolytic subunit [Biophytum sensitivum]
MPIGVPRVIWQRPGPGPRLKAWVDINRLYRERFLFLGQGVDSTVSNQLIALMLYLAYESALKDIYFFINSPGGWVVPGIAIYDTMEHVRPDVQTICFSFAASMGSFLLVGGAIGKRLAFPHARVMIHQPAAIFLGGQVSDVVLEAGELLKLRELLTQIYAERTGKPLWVLTEDMERDVFMSATEAQAHGIIDRVVGMNKKNR